MQPIVVLLSIALAAYGYTQAGILGALTGLVAGVGVGSGLAIYARVKGTDLDTSTQIRDAQRAGGMISAIACAAGAKYGGWTYGWALGLGGYVLGALSAVLLGTLLMRHARVEAARLTEADVPNESDPIFSVVPFSVFENRTKESWPTRMDTRAYEGSLFKCACGVAHPFNRSITVPLRELSGMRLVLICPTRHFATCVKVTGVIGFNGFVSLFGANLRA